MNRQSFTTTLVLDQTPQEVFDAINDVRAWWPGEIEGQTDVVGATFTYRYKDLHTSTQKVTELVPGKRVVWHIVTSKLDFVQHKDEWTGTDVVFEIAKKRDKTELRFTHVGLVPAVECYDACSNGWSFCVNDSLRDLITKGKGRTTFQERAARRLPRAPLTHDARR